MQAGPWGAINPDLIVFLAVLIVAAWLLNALGGKRRR